ncbi:MAG: hypothetical protein LCH76_13820 [Actinobacteria bacterium]|nr:hypothetical protein [Actinomycetota bacterium]
MNGRPVRWRARWFCTQVTGLLFSTAAWLVMLGLNPRAVEVSLLLGVLFVAGCRTRPVLWLAYGARPVAPADRDLVLAAIVPVGSLRGRNQPRVFIARGRRSAGWDVAVPGPRLLVVSERLVSRIRAGRISDLEVSVLVAQALGQLPALGSRAALAVDGYCLPWTVVRTVSSAVARRFSLVALVSLSWRMRPLVFGMALVDSVQNSRWEAAIPLVVMSVLTYTTGPLERAWRRRLAELGDRQVAAEGLAQAAPVPSQGSRFADRRVQ